MRGTRERLIPSVSLHHSSGPPLRRRDSKREELARVAGGSSRWRSRRQDDGRSRRTDLPSPQTPRGVVRISFVAPALPAATRRSRRPSNGTIPCPAPTRDVSRVGLLADQPLDQAARLLLTELGQRRIAVRRLAHPATVLAQRDVEPVGAGGIGGGVTGARTRP